MVKIATHKARKGKYFVKTGQFYLTVMLSCIMLFAVIPAFSLDFDIRENNVIEFLHRTFDYEPSVLEENISEISAVLTEPLYEVWKEWMRQTVTVTKTIGCVSFFDLDRISGEGDVRTAWFEYGTLLANEDEDPIDSFGVSDIVKTTMVAVFSFSGEKIASVTVFWPDLDWYYSKLSESGIETGALIPETKLAETELD